MRRRGIGALLALLAMLLAQLLLLGAADSDTTDSEKKGQDSSGEARDAAEGSDKEALPLLAIPPAPIDEPDPADDKASANGVTASSRKLPAKGKNKTAKSGTIESRAGDRSDKVKAAETESQATVEPAASDSGEAVDVLVSSNVKSVRGKGASPLNADKQVSAIKAKAEQAGKVKKETQPATGANAGKLIGKPQSGSTGKTTSKTAQPITRDKTILQSTGSPSNTGKSAASAGAQAATISSSPAEPANVSAGRLELPSDKQKKPVSSGLVEAADGIEPQLDDSGAAAIGSTLPANAGSQSPEKALGSGSDGQPDLLAGAAPSGLPDPGSSGAGGTAFGYLMATAIVIMLAACLILLGREVRSRRIAGSPKRMVAGPASSSKSMKVVETISLGSGKQILIVELRGELLVLASTATSISLLDKLPASTLGGARPLVVNGTFGQQQSDAAEMRRGQIGLSIAEIPATGTDGPRWSRGAEASGSQLISQIRQQLEGLEKA